METMTQGRAVESPVGAFPQDIEALADCYVPSGRIGTLDLRSGCYSAAEVFRLAAEDLARRGLAEGATAALGARVTTVRRLLAEKYGCPLGPREYWTPRNRTPDQEDAWEFLRVLARAVRTERRAA